MTAAIEATSLAKRYGDQLVVDDVSFCVAAGEIFGYLGRNGSGKTTTVRMLTSLTRPTSGSARVAGFDVMTDPTEVKARIGVTMQDAALDPQMSGREHLEFIARILGYNKQTATKRSDEMLELFGLTDAAERASATYSGGMRRRLDIATALLGEAEVLFLDEPTTGLDPQSRRAMWAEISNLKRRGSTVFLTTQYLEEAEVLADHLAIIDQGRLIARGTPAALKAEHARRHASFRDNGNTARLANTLPADIDIVESMGRIHLEAPGSTNDDDMLALLAQIAADCGPIQDLEITTTSLEDVFLQLTGTAINESAEHQEAS